MKKSEQKDIPYFIRIRGCINCDASKTLKEIIGNDYGFDHEIMAQCLLLGCFNYGFDLSRPYYDPEEAVRLANKDGQLKVKEKARKYCLGLKESFSDFYDKLGISIDEMLKKLNEKQTSSASKTQPIS